MELDKVIKNIGKNYKDIEKDAQHKIDLKTKPLGSLGILEAIVVKMSMIQNNLNPVIKNKALFVFAGDHGIASEGVSAFPAEVTPQMVFNFLNGGAAINVLCRHNDIDIKIIDMGVNYDFEKNNKLIDKKVKKGTKNFIKYQAMTRDEAVKSIQNGIDVFNEIHIKKRIDIIGLGDMGIGNTTSSSAIISCITGVDPEKCTGRGTGIDDLRFQNKVNLIKKAIFIHKPRKDDAIDILQKIGGFEIAGIAGAILAASYNKVPVVIDGIISTAGAIIAYLLNPNVSDYIFAGHKSIEIGQKAALEFMNLEPIIDLKMRLGEGTGASLAIGIIDASCRIMREMASFEEAGVSNKE